MLKTMGFRNSGKLDLGGKNMEYILAGVLLLIIITAVVLAVGPIRCGDGASGPVGKPRVKCLECKEEWFIESKDVRKFEREVDMEGGAVAAGIDCPHCKKKGCVYRMNQCPKCKEYYLSKRITDPDAFAEGGYKEICPKCKTDVYKWYKEHRRH